MRFKGYKSGGKLPPTIKEPNPPLRDTLSDKTDSTFVKRQPVVHPQEVATDRRERLVILDEVFFDVNRAELKPGFTGKLDSLIAFLASHPAFKVNISGHTDDRGEKTNNASLSTARARAVAAYLRDNRIAGSRIAFSGEGSSRPIASNDTVEGRRKNRRVEMIISQELAVD